MEGTSRILVVEDNPRNQRVVQRLLEKHGYRVEVADNGQEAVEAVREVAFDLVIMDIQMPVLDGIAATEQLRDEGFDVPILALTAYASDDDRRRCDEVGMDGFVAKPFEQRELLDAVARLTDAVVTPTDAGSLETDHPPVRVEHFRELMREAGIEEIVGDALRAYRDESPGRLERIESAMKGGEARALEEEIHALKSASLNIWAVELAEYLDQAEIAAVVGDVRQAQALMEAIRVEFGRVVAYLDLMLSGP